MPNNTVENKKVKPLPSEDAYNDSDKLNDLLIASKAIGKLLGTFAEEASNDTLFNQVCDISKNVGQLSRDVFNLMFAKGWYKLEQETEEKIKQVHTQYKKEASKLK